ncbi:putative G-protein coupled receptor CG31760 [Oratosquilla oratoria]|uniref:putative G-protein coupled receptor CG31760 n=1 Tax=Oratosquilla oratoria TaxID=337810 RepID=UPI003F774DDA
MIMLIVFGYHTYTWNDTTHTERIEEEILHVAYEDGRWSKPYFDCGGGNIWMMTYAVPFFGYANGTYYFKGTSGIDIDLRRVDIDQCPLPPGSTAMNIFADSAKCKKRTTRCETIPGLGFRRGSYKCVCKSGFFFPDTAAARRYFNGSQMEEEYEKKMLGEPSFYEEEGYFECLPCAEGCEICVDASPCVVSLNWFMRTAILLLAIIIILLLPVVLMFTFKYGHVKVLRAASPVLLRIILLGAFFIYCTTLVMYPIPTIITCTLRIWLREIGFSLTYGALMLKTWRISVIFRVRSAKAVKITDLDLVKRLGVIVGVCATFLGIRTIVAPPQVIVRMTADDLKAFLCSSDWWDHTFCIMELSFMVWGIRLCLVVRKAPSEFNESKFISMTIYNEFLLSFFLNVSMLFLQSPANPDLLFIIFFCHTQVTITLLLAAIFGSKAYLVMKGQGKGEDSVSMTKPIAAKFLTKPKPGNSHLSTTSSSGGVLEARLTEGDVQEEFRRLYMQLEVLKERNLRMGNRHLAAKITAMQQAASSPEVAIEKLPVTVTSNGQEPKPKPPQITDSKVSGSTRRRSSSTADGVVMKPHVNNILANVTDKIVCATFRDDGVGDASGDKKPSVRDASTSISTSLNTLSTKTKDAYNTLGKGVGKNRRPNSFVSSGSAGGAPRGDEDTNSEACSTVGSGDGHYGSSRASSNGGSSGGSCAGSDASCRSSCGSGDCGSGGCDRYSDDPGASDSGGSGGKCARGDRYGVKRGRSTSGAAKGVMGCRADKTQGIRSSSHDMSAPPPDPGQRNSTCEHQELTLGCLSAENLLENSQRLLEDPAVTERGCRSLENLDETGSGLRSGRGCRGREDCEEDRSVRSAHSTPRHGGLERFREIRDPERARAFILTSLSDRATLTEEVTV